MKMCAGKTAVVFIFLPVIWLSGCHAIVHVASPEPKSAPPPSILAGLDVARPGYAVQIGAFSVLDNARKAAEALNGLGLDAYFFRQGTGTYKVRFGNFHSRGAADREAKRLRNEAIIADYFVVSPEDRPLISPDIPGDDLRNRLAATAESFIGVDYSWGGATSREGFDCSGLVKEVYELNGLSLPRSVAEQFKAGTTVSEGGPLKGDLVFFSAVPGGPLSHVGICVGGKSFIHSPGKGKKVREESLDNAYFRENYSGARAYLN